MATYRILLVFVVGVCSAEQHGPFTADFVKFMERNPERNEYILSAYHEYGIDGTFGGRRHGELKGPITRHPVLFVHGNSDSALNHSASSSGWTKSVEHFKDLGYNSSELYGLTYGSRNINNSLHNHITCRNIVGIRRFIETILAYTQAEKIDIIAHSMGVSLARKAVQGGMVHMTEEVCDLGDPINHQVDAFVALAGANYGMCVCLSDNMKGEVACGQEGFTPGGDQCGSMAACLEDGATCPKHEYAAILKQINKSGVKEATFVASLWSNDDNILGKNNNAWGVKTSLVPNSDYHHDYSGLNHFEMKENTTDAQYNLVTIHKRHSGRCKRHH